MSQFEYDLNDKDYKLVATEYSNPGMQLDENTYVRLIVFEVDNRGDLPEILSFTDVGEPANSPNPQNRRAIFYSSLSEIPFEINTSPFDAELNEISTKTIGGDLNDFKIYQNPNGSIYLKPNELFSTFGIVEGNYKIQIDFLSQLNEKVNIRFENFVINNKLVTNGHLTINGDIYPNVSNIEDFPIFTTDLNLPQIPKNELGEVISPSPCDNLIYWSDNTISIGDIRNYFGLNGINTNSDFLSTLPFPQYFEEFNFNGNDILNNTDSVGWIEVNRPDISDYITQVSLGNIPSPPRASDSGVEPNLPTLFYNNDLSIIPAPIKSVFGVGSATTYNSAIGWMGNLNTLEQGRYYIIELDDDIPDFEINFNDENRQINLSGPHIFIPSNESLYDDFYKFIIREISTSRKEVRLKLIDKNIDTTQILGQTTISHITSELNKDRNGNITDKYQFNHKLNLGNGTHIQIMNYSFDAVTDGKDNQSIILRLYEPLPTSINNLQHVTIEQEKLTTQTEDVVYFAESPPDEEGTGLIPDSQENWINFQGVESNFQSFNDLTSSIEKYAIKNLISQSQYDYPNLNTDFRFFKNHTFFGSAKKKLENFKTKVETIQGYYTDISSSLFAKGVSIVGDSNAVIQDRKNLFEKINQEINSFTPYERFLYFDGQQESTASAPGVGKNYADTIPVTLSGEGVDLGLHNGFTSVYKHSSEKVSGTHNIFIDLFTDKYKVENKPFFNYDDSIYLSFLLQGNSGSKFTWANRNKNLNPPLPEDTLYQNNILNPDMTSSAHQRYIFEASMSYFVPNTTNNDMNELSKEAGDFNAGSSKITILSGNVKTGSERMRDTLNRYPTTVISQSGTPFFGSVMPAGELFRIYYTNTLSSSLQGYMNFDLQTSGSNVTDDMMLSVSAEGSGTLDVPATAPNDPPTVASGVEVHGRQYGQSVQFLSESRHELDFDDEKFNFGRDDNFSLAIWAKRFHPNTGSADSGKHGGSGSCNLIGRGSTAISYGITYAENQNRISAGVRGPTPLGGSGATSELVTFNMSDDLLNWHHFVFTYESGSSTGLNLYVDGNLEDTDTTLAPNFSITGSYDFTASNYSTEPLAVGGNEIVGGNNVHFSGFLQYPRVYDRAISAEEVNSLYLNPPGITETKITDVKITLNNPSNVLPFDNVYKTTSPEWTSWYNGMIDSASAFDNENIHSLQNNLPIYIQEGAEHEEMKTFVSFQGEQYDIVKNHIDSMGTLNDRGYKKTDSPPSNTYPILLENLGYKAINPFVGNLNDTLGGYLTGVTSIDDIKNNTFRKTLNNLLYIYKSKGTANSVRGLLNIYGYPPDVIKVKESTNVNVPNNTDLIPDNPPIQTLAIGGGSDLDLSLGTGSVSFTSKKQKLQNYTINGNKERTLGLDWWTNGANINTFEIIYKHKKTSNNQTILLSSGSGDEHLWELRLTPDVSNVSASLEFRLSNEPGTASNATLNSNAVSMSTSYLPLNDGEIFNVMLQRVSSDGVFSANTTNEYRLHLAKQENTAIKTYNYVTMSIDGASSNSNKYANENWQSTGSRGYLDRGNLLVGHEMSGSLSEIKSWNTSLSTSRFRQHVLNKFSTVGNTINSFDKEMVYNFKLNENYTTSSISSSAQVLTIIDSAPKCNLITNYSIGKSGSLFEDSNVYGFDIVDKVTLGLKDNNSFGENENGILINPQSVILGDLSSNGIVAQGNVNNVPINKPSVQLDIFNSPQSIVNNEIINRIDNFDFEKYYGNPQYYYSSSYTDFDNFKKDFFKCNPIQVDINKYIRSQENIYNNSIIDGIKTTVPARSTLSDENSNIGVEIKPTIFEKQKYEHHRHSVEVNPNSPIGNKEIIIDLSETIYDSVKEGTVQSAPSLIGSNEVPHNIEISLGNSYITSSGYLKDSPAVNHNHPPFLQPGGYVTTIENPYTITLDTSPSYAGSTVVLSKDGTIDYASRANESYKSVHKDWGTGEDNVQFINFASNELSSNNDYNVAHIDTRFHFYSIGDTEYYSGSKGNSTDFTNHNRFYNRLMISNDFHSNITYESLINGNPGNQVGRMIGKTRYFITSSTGEYILPRNHVINFNKPFKEQMYNGTQNTRPGKLNFAQEDYSVDSFYVVKVTGGENQIIVKGNESSDLDSQDRIIY